MKKPYEIHEGPFTYHQEIELRIDNLTNLGMGVGRIDDWVVMVPFVIPGELVKARVFKNHKNYSEADLLEIIEASPERVEAQCGLFTECGGCQYQHMSYRKQLEIKTQHVQELLDRLVEHEVSEKATLAIGSPKEYNYRSKITPHFQKAREGKIRDIGFLRFGRRQQLIDVEQCPIAMENINEKLIEERHRIHTKGTGKKKNKGGTLLLRACMEGVETDNTKTITELVGKRSYQFKAGDFFQNNPFILPEFVDFILKQAEGNRYLIDAYCGSGLFSIAGAQYFEKSIGIEVNASAVQWAKNNAHINGLANCDFKVGEAEKIFEVIDFPGSESTVIIDPPRKGCDQDFLDQLNRFAPDKIVYVSCDPATQARDLNSLLDHYEITHIQPFDLFPHTRHIENVVSLKRKG